MPDPYSDAVYAALEREFGGPIHEWPRPDSSLMSRAQVDWALAAVGLPATDNAFLMRFWRERQHGQLDEDFGGFLWRCWCAALQVPNEFLDRYGRGCARGPTLATTLLIKSLEAIIENDDDEYAGELADAEVTGERPDLDDREVSVPVEWLRDIVARLQAAA